MKTIFVKCLASAAFLGALALPMAAQADTYYHHGVNARWHNQQHRIYNGEQTGRLTPRESVHLERREFHIRSMEARDRFHHGGHLTFAERRRLERAENRTSGAIYHHKHNW